MPYSNVKNTPTVKRIKAVVGASAPTPFPNSVSTAVCVMPTGVLFSVASETH
jgi:hypothetical protein